jgi:hypothetical protein
MVGDPVATNAHVLVGIAAVPTRPGVAHCAKGVANLRMTRRLSWVFSRHGRCFDRPIMELIVWTSIAVAGRGWASPTCSAAARAPRRQ